MLPQQYIDDAEKEALFESAKRLHTRENVEYTYKATLDELYAKRNWGTIGGYLNIGYFVKLTVPEFFEGSENIRIISVKEYVDKPKQPIIELSNTVTGRSAYSSAISQSKTQEQTKNRLHKDQINYTKRGWADTQELIKAVKGMVDDFENSELSADVLKGMIGLFGSESLQFQFLDTDWLTAITPFISFDPKTKQLSCRSARIQHMTLGIDTLQPNRATSSYKFWTAPDYISPVLSKKNEPYFLYLKASKSLVQQNERNVGEAMFLLSTGNFKLEDIDDYYTFWVGYLNSENIEGDRSFRTMYGYTEILPGQITVDKLLSTSGALVIDLLNGVITAKDGATIQGNIKFLSNNGNYQNLNEELNKTNDKIDNLQIGGVNLLRNSDFKNESNNLKYWNASGNYELYTIATARPNGSNNNTLYIETNERGGAANNFLTEASKKLVEGKTYTLSFWAAIHMEVGIIHFEMWGGIGSIDFANSASWQFYTHTFTVSEENADQSLFFWIEKNGAFYINSIQLEEGNKTTPWKLSPEDVQEVVTLAKEVADKAKNSAEQATFRLNDWASDAIISPTEKTALRQQLADVQSEYQEIANQATKYSLTGSNEWSNYYSGYNLAVSAITKYTAVNPENIPVESDYFNIAAYYPKRQNILDLIASSAKKYAEDLVDNLQIGGRNYISQNNYTINEYITNSVILPAGDYIATCYNCTFENIRIDGIGFTFSNKFTLAEKKEVTLYALWGGYNPVSTEQIKCKIERGNKATDWTPKPEDQQAEIDNSRYLQTALANRTEIDGGLLLTSLLKLGTFSGNILNEKAGINGTVSNPNDVIAWFGGTLQQAIQNLASIVFRMDGSGQLAKGNIGWDPAGNTNIKGKFESNSEGNRIIIDPENRVMKMMNADNKEILCFEFTEYSNGAISPKITCRTYLPEGGLYSTTYMSGSSLVSYTEELPALIEIKPGSLSIRDKNTTGNDALNIGYNANNTVEIEAKLRTTKSVYPNVFYRNGNSVNIS